MVWEFAQLIFDLRKKSETLKAGIMQRTKMDELDLKCKALLWQRNLLGGG